MICCERVACSCAFAADVASCRCLSDSLCLLAVVAVVEAIVMLLAFCASCDACGECAAVDAGSFDHLGLRCLSLMILGAQLFHLMLWCSRECLLFIGSTLTHDGAIITV